MPERRAKAGRNTSDMSNYSLDEVSESPPVVTQLGITVNVSSAEGRVAPAIYRNEADTVDYYLINVTWQQEYYGERDKTDETFADPFQDQLSNVVVQYTVAKRFSVIKAFHEQHFSMYPEFAQAWPGPFVNPFTVCGRAALVNHRIAALDHYLSTLVTSQCAPNALSELALFLELPFPQNVTLTRPMNASQDDTINVLANGGEGARECTSSIVLAVPPPEGASPVGGGLVTGDVVQVVKEGSSSKGRCGIVKEAFEEKMVVVELLSVSDPEAAAEAKAEAAKSNNNNNKRAVRPQLSRTASSLPANPLSPSSAMRKTYKFEELQLVSRASEDVLTVFVGETNVHLPTGLLLAKGMRRQFEYEGRINASHVDIDVEVERLWEENKRLREENEQLAVVHVAKGQDRVARKAAEKVAAEARKEAEKHKTEKALLAKQLLERQQQMSSSGGSSGGSNGGGASNNGTKHHSTKGVVRGVMAGLKGGLMADHDITLKEAVQTLQSVPSASEPAVLNALKRLINLSLNSEEHALELSRMGGIVYIDTVMGNFQSHAQIQEKGLKLLVNLSFMSVEAATEILKRGLVKRMVGALDRHPNVSGVQVKGLWGLKNLAHHNQGAFEVVQQQGVRAGCRGLKAHLALEGVVTSGLGMLQNVAHHCGAKAVSEEWNKAGLSFSQVRKVHGNSPEVLDIASQLEQDLARK